MAAFNYRQLIRQVPPRTWQFYFQSRKVELPADHAWDMPAQKLIPALIKVTDALPDHQSKRIYAELRRVHELANPRGVDALPRSSSRPATSILCCVAPWLIDAWSHCELWRTSASMASLSKTWTLSWLDRARLRRHQKRRFD